jgi:uncharacterized Tic20 family protein
MQVPSDIRTYAALIHLSPILGNFLFGGFANFLFPLIMWIVRRNDHPFIDETGKEVVNFHLSLLIYYLIGIAFAIMTLGLGLLVVIPFWLVMSGLTIIFAIIGAIKASDGEIYRYPLNLRLIK